VRTADVSFAEQISDALIKLKVASGGHLPGIFSHSPKDTSSADICGPAFTVEVSEIAGPLDESSG
jgi:hypothetical protein